MKASILAPRIAVAVLVLASLSATPARGAPPAATPDEQARELFLAQRYGEALTIYERLRAETQHPTYLRNIGRCHQMLRQPAPAIAAFDAYLREAPNLEAAEQAEVQGYIAEMRALQLSAPPPPVSAPVANAPAPPEMEGESSITHKWWFWAGIAAVVVATGVVIALNSGGNDRLPCPSGAVCP